MRFLVFSLLLRSRNHSYYIIMNTLYAPRRGLLKCIAEKIDGVNFLSDSTLLCRKLVKIMMSRNAARDFFLIFWMKQSARIGVMTFLRCPPYNDFSSLPSAAINVRPDMPYGNPAAYKSSHNVHKKTSNRSRGKNIIIIIESRKRRTTVAIK